MTVTMTASGARLLLLALCVYRGWGLQQSAPRVRLSFKGELLQINPPKSPHPPPPPSSQAPLKHLTTHYPTPPPATPRQASLNSFSLHTHTHKATQTPTPHHTGYTSSLYVSKERISCHMSNCATLETKGGYYVWLVTAGALRQNFSLGYTP